LDYKFQFMGALEVFSREAVDLFFQKGGICQDKLIQAHPKAGEDFYMKACMDAIGVDSVEDFKLLVDHTCGDDCLGGAKGPCSNGWIAAYHSYRDVGSWNKCHGEALAAQKEAKLDGAPAAPAPAEEEEIPAVSSDGAEKAEDLLDKARDTLAKAKPAADAAAAKNESAWKHIHAASDKVEQAEQLIDAARHDQSSAEAVVKAAEKKIAEAEAIQRAAKEASAAAAAKKADGTKKLGVAEELVSQAQQAEKTADQEREQAIDAEGEELANMGDQRVCLDLPGVRVTDTKALDLKPVVAEMDTSTPEKCSLWCREHKDCKQSVFSAENKGCYFFNEASGQPLMFNDKFNSSYCGILDEKDDMLDMLKKVFKMKPYVPDVRKCSWAGDNCLETKCCANVPVPNWKFTEFQWYTCYKRDEYFGSCRLGEAPGGWDGTVLGHMGTREVPKAPEGILVQGTSLFCFAVVMWRNPPKEAFWDSEAALANNMKKMGRSIFGCDGHAFFEGTALGGGDSSSINNIDSFIGAWNKVRDDGRYLKHDWTVKVDCDAVFFPDRLKMHLGNLRTPQGSRVYLKNINFKFNFLGALEVFTREALELYFAKSGECAGKVGHQGGEDYYMEACMDGIGIDHQTDFRLLNDKYAATGNCNDAWAVGFHFYKKVASWNACHDAAVNAAKAAGSDYAEAEAR